MQTFIMPDRFRGDKLKAWLIANHGSDPGTLRIRRGIIYVHDDIPLTQADIDTCVTPPEEIAEAAERRDLQAIEVRLLRRAIGILAPAMYPHLSVADQDALADIRNKLQRLDELEEGQ